MKKIILCLMLLGLNLFGYYSSENMIDFLVHSNQLRIRTDRFGALFGSRNIRAAIGLTGSQNAAGIILQNLSSSQNLADDKVAIDQLVPSVLGAIGYDSDIFGVALGYEFTWKSPTYMVHTPILHMTALDDNFRINIPVSIGVGQQSRFNRTENLEGTLVVSTGIEARYYFNQPYFSHIRVFFNYGNSTIKDVAKDNVSFTQQSIGFQARAYFRYELPYNMVLEPILRIQFDAALKTKYVNVNNNDVKSILDSYSVTAKGFSPSKTLKTAGSESSAGANADSTYSDLSGGYIGGVPNEFYAEEPYRLGIALPLGMRAASENRIVEFYLEPALSLTIVNAKNIYDSSTITSGESLDKATKIKSPFYTFGYVVYGELYVRPIPQLEWYFELQTGGATVAGNLAQASSTSLVFNGATGITWYF